MKNISLAYKTEQIQSTIFDEIFNEDDEYIRFSEKYEVIHLGKFGNISHIGLDSSVESMLNFYANMQNGKQSYLSKLDEAYASEKFYDFMSRQVFLLIRCKSDPIIYNDSNMYSNLTNIKEYCLTGYLLTISVDIKNHKIFIWGCTKYGHPVYETSTGEHEVLLTIEHSSPVEKTHNYFAKKILRSLGNKDTTYLLLPFESIEVEYAFKHSQIFVDENIDFKTRIIDVDVAIPYTVLANHSKIDITKSEDKSSYIFTFKYRDVPIFSREYKTYEEAIETYKDKIDKLFVSFDIRTRLYSLVSEVPE